MTISWRQKARDSTTMQSVNKNGNEHSEQHKRSAPTTSHDNKPQPKSAKIVSRRFYKNNPELVSEFFRLQDAVFLFFSDRFFDDDDVADRAQELKDIIHDAFVENGMKGYGNDGGKEMRRLSEIVDLHLARITSRVTVEMFKSSQPDPPAVRIGPMDYRLTPEEFAWFEQVCRDGNTTIREWTKSNICQSFWYGGPIENEHWIAFSWGYNYELNGAGEANFPTHYPNFSTLRHLRELSICPTTPSVRISDIPSLARISINGDVVEHIVLEKINPTEMNLMFSKSLKCCDISQLHVTKLSKLDVKGSKNLVLRCTEAQFQYSQTLRSIRGVKKDRIASNSNHIHELVQAYHFDQGLSFPKWVVKQLACDKASALTIYWLGNPINFVGKSARDVDSTEEGRYKLLKLVAKLVKQQKFQASGSLTFDIQDHVEPHRMEAARLEIPNHMFSL